MEVSVQQLVEFIFERNVNNCKVAIELEQFTDLKDLFSFCVDLLCKGIFILIGNRQKIDIDSITAEGFRQVCEKLLTAGIKVYIETTANTFNNPPSVNLLEPAGDCSKPIQLSDYYAEIVTCNNIHRINFDLVRI